MSNKSLEKLANTVSMLSVDAVQKANSGHPGLPMGAAFFSSLLWSEYLRFDPKDPNWAGRDRFILSAGHGSMLLYSLLNVFGYDLSIDDVKAFRQWGSKTPGHPEFGHTAGVEATTGPLGQGFANAVGMALAAKLKCNRFCNDLFDTRTFVLASDGDLMEGISSEAASIAGHLKLSNLVCLYDDNEISLDGPTELCFVEDPVKRFESVGWRVEKVDAYDGEAIRKALDSALAQNEKPTILCLRSVIGKGSPAKAGKSASHGAPLGPDEVKATKVSLGLDPEADFFVPDEVSEFCGSVVAKNQKAKADWDAKFSQWKSGNTAKAESLAALEASAIPSELREELLAGLEHNEPTATRVLSSRAVQVLAKHSPRLISGSADLQSSTKTDIKGSPDISATDFSGRNVRYGVREHAMGAMANGMAYEGTWFPLVSTFLVFSDYMRAPIRLAALSNLQSCFVFTHDSIWVGEDGPTHEPVEHVASLRLIPNVHVHRPADGLETGVAYLAALERKNAPTVIVCSRQGLPPIARKDGFKKEDVLKGGYVLKETDSADVTLVATGSEVALALQVSEILSAQNINCRLVSMPCVEAFQEQSREYKNSVIPDTIPSVSIEAGVTSIWASVTGPCGLNLGIDTFGASAPGAVIAEKLGLHKEAVAEKIKKFLS